MCSVVLIQDAPVAINVEGPFEFAPDQDGDMDTRVGTEAHVDLNFARLFRIPVPGTVSIAARHVIPHEQGTILPLTPSIGFHHTCPVPCAGTAGSEEAIVPS